MVHAAGDRVGAGLRAGPDERQGAGALLDEGARELDRRRLVDGGGPPHEDHDRFDLGPLDDRQQQRAADLAGCRQARDADGELVAVGGEETAAGPRDPADPGGALGPRREVAEAPLALEQEDLDEILRGADTGEVVDVNLLGAGRDQQLARQGAEDRVRLDRPVGERGQPTDPPQQALHPDRRR